MNPKIPLKERLAQLMPDIAEAMRRKHFHSFLTEKVEEKGRLWGEKRSEAEVERIVRENEAVLKRDGVDEGGFAELPDWRKAVLHQRRTAAGQRGGRQKQASEEARAAKMKAREAKKRKRTKPDLEFHGEEATLDALAHPSPRTLTRTLLH